MTFPVGMQISPKTEKFSLTRVRLSGPRKILIGPQDWEYSFNKVTSSFLSLPATQAGSQALQGEVVSLALSPGLRSLPPLLSVGAGWDAEALRAKWPGGSTPMTQGCPRGTLLCRVVWTL